MIKSDNELLTSAKITVPELEDPVASQLIIVEQLGLPHEGVELAVHGVKQLDVVTVSHSEEESFSPSPDPPGVFPGGGPIPGGQNGHPSPGYGGPILAIHSLMCSPAWLELCN